MSFFKQDNEKGVAILIAIAVISVLLTAGLELNRKSRITAESSATARDRLVISQMAASGVNAALILLINDKMDSETDSLQEDWADPEKVDAFLQQMPFEDGNVSVEIIDEMSKIQINALVQFPEGRAFNTSQLGLWERFSEKLLSLFEDLEDTDSPTIINSIKDWIDSGDDDAITGISGAESGYYKDLDPPYECRNAPFVHTGEVALVKGVLPEIFYGLSDTWGLSGFITIHGAIASGDEKFTFEGKININTAQLPVLMALLPPENDDFAQALIDYREETTQEGFAHDLTSISWYKNVPGFSGIDIDANLITVTSDTYRIVSKASLHGLKYGINAVVKRQQDKNTGKWTCKTLNWQVK